MPALQRCFLICSRRRRRHSTCTLVSTDSTLVCSPNASSTAQHGQNNRSKHAICSSVISARARAELLLWLQRPRCQKMSALWCHVVDAPISLPTHCPTSRRRPCPSPVATTVL